jgi:hypothetical protein
LRLLKEITAARIDDAKQRERDAASNTVTPSRGDRTGGISGGSGAPAAAAPAGNTINVYSLGTPRELANILKPEIDKLGRLGG